MTIASPSASVCGLLDAQTINPPAPGILLSYGRNVFRGYSRAPTNDGFTVPHTAIFVLTTGGVRPIHYKSVDVTKDRLFADVSVLIRYDVNNFEDGEDFARSVWKLLQRDVPINYLECHCLNSEPIYGGLDDTEHPRWTINLELVRAE